MQLIVKTVSHHLRELERSFYGNATEPSRKISHCVSSAGESPGLAAPTHDSRKDRQRPQPTQGSLGFVCGPRAADSKGTVQKRSLFQDRPSLSGKTDSDSHPTHLICKEKYLLNILCFLLLQWAFTSPRPLPLPASPKAVSFSSVLLDVFALEWPQRWASFRSLCSLLLSLLCTLFLDDTIYSQGPHYYTNINNSQTWISSLTSQLNFKSIFTLDP